MKNRIHMLMATATLCFAGNAVADVVFPVDIDLDNGLAGQNLWFGTELSADPLTGIAWDLEFVPEQGSASTPAEIVFVLTHLGMGFQESFDGSNGNVFDLNPTDHDLGWDDAPASFADSGVMVAGTDIPAHPVASGTWSLVIYDEFDNIGMVDGHLTGTITVLTSPVPAPGALALLGGAALVGRRRRR